MNIFDYILIGITAVCLVLALVYILKEKKKGRCIGCSHCNSCQSCKNINPSLKSK